MLHAAWCAAVHCVTAVLWCKVGMVQELRAAVCCSATACAGDEALVGAQVESLSHLFVHCPVVQPAVAWLRGVWALLVAGRVPPLDVRVLLAGDHTVWDPGGGEAGAELWTHLRLLFFMQLPPEWLLVPSCKQQPSTPSHPSAPSNRALCLDLFATSTVH